MRLQVRRRSELVTVHENLLCASSSFFRSILQSRRQEISDECPLCLDALQPDVGELTYCSASCGGNFHYACIENWRKRTVVPDTTKCPLCRHIWIFPDALQVHNLQSVDSDAFDVYIEWLYRGRFEIGGALRSYYVTLVETYALGIQLNNSGFCKALLEAFIEGCIQQNRFPTPTAVTYIYTKTDHTSTLRRFLVSFFRQFNSELLQLVLEEWDKYPPAFTRDLFRAFAKGTEPDVEWDEDALKAKLCSLPAKDDDADDMPDMDDYDPEEEEDASDDDESEGAITDNGTSSNEEDY